MARVGSFGHGLSHLKFRCSLTVPRRMPRLLDHLVGQGDPVLVDRGTTDQVVLVFEAADRVEDPTGRADDFGADAVAGLAPQSSGSHSFSFFAPAVMFQANIVEAGWLTHLGQQAVCVLGELFIVEDPPGPGPETKLRRISRILRWATRSSSQHSTSRKPASISRISVFPARRRSTVVVLTEDSAKGARRLTTPSASITSAIAAGRHIARSGCRLAGSPWPATGTGRHGQRSSGRWRSRRHGRPVRQSWSSPGPGR